MDQMQQKQSSNDTARPKGQLGCDAFPPAGPGQPPWPTAQEEPIVSPSGRLQKNAGLGLPQVAVVSAKATDPMQPGQTTRGVIPAPLASISRPRPTALGTKPAIKPTRVSEDLSKDMDHITVCIPGPQSANNTHSQSPTESLLSLQSPPSPPSARPYTIQPCPNFQPCPNSASSYSPKLSPIPHSQGVRVSPTENVQQSVETDEFR